jgi:long-chain fatty acid transport protein
MKGIVKRTLTSAAVAALVVSPLANATNGYFTIGAGSKNRGMAGAGIAFGQDSLAGAINPASLAGISTRTDFGVELFKPKRKGEVDARGLDTNNVPPAFRPPGYTPLAGADSSEKSRSNAFFLPHFGIAKVWSSKVTLGLSVIGVGGMNTRYGDANGGNGNIYSDAFAPAIGNCSDGTQCPQPTPPFPPLNSGFAGLVEAQLQQPPPAGAGLTPGQAAGVGGGNLFSLFTNPNNTPALGVNLAQALITPTIAFRVTPTQSIGFSPVIGYQTFRAYGLGLFQGFSSDPGKVTNNGNDDSWGYGAQIGYKGDFGMFSIGAMARSKIYMDKFSKYSGLFAEGGDFDIPAYFGVGVAAHVTSGLTIAVDVNRILYGGVDSISNKGPTADEFFNAMGGVLASNPAAISNPLGSNNGWGFGWNDVWVYKVGVNYAYDNNWTFRAGFNYSPTPYNDSQALFNVLAPAVVEKHVTAGFTRSLTPNSEITVAYMYAFRNDVENTYQGTGNNAAFSFTAKNDMYQNALEVSYGLKF